MAPLTALAIYYSAPMVRGLCVSCYLCQDILHVDEASCSW